MKETRKLHIKNRIFRIDDLKRFAAFIADQGNRANQRSENISVEYEFHFADDTTVQSKLPDILDDELLFCSKRPTSIQFSFLNHSQLTRIILSLNHGDSSYGNSLIVSGSEREWVNDVFSKLSSILEGVAPQDAWLESHPTLALNVIALGIGTVATSAIQFFVKVLLTGIDLAKYEEPPTVGSFWFVVNQLSQSRPWFFYLLGWVWKWSMGFSFGAFELRRWFQRLWPSIELDMGPEHLKSEKKRRSRVYAVIVLLIMPIVAAAAYDLSKYVFSR